jgi:hypothetical protein
MNKWEEMIEHNQNVGTILLDNNDNVSSVATDGEDKEDDFEFLWNVNGPPLAAMMNVKSDWEGEDHTGVLKNLVLKFPVCLQMQGWISSAMNLEHVMTQLLQSMKFTISKEST